MNGENGFMFGWWTHRVLRVPGFRIRFPIGIVHRLCVRSKYGGDILVLT